MSVDAEQVLHAVADASDDAIVALDATGRILSWNRSAERIFGYPTEDVIGRPSAMLFPEHLRDRMSDVLDAVIAGDRVDRFEAEIGRRDDMPVPVSLTACPVFVQREALLTTNRPKPLTDVGPTHPHHSPTAPKPDEGTSLPKGTSCRLGARFTRGSVTQVVG